jgi:3-hydroxybutyryl-CoA dehydratase
MIINGKRYSMQESFTVEITEEMQETFTKLSGDVNPLHLSNKFAKQRGFQIMKI